MEMIELTVKNVEEYNKELVSLFEQSFELSFPHEEINKSSIVDDIESLKQYISKEEAIVYGSFINGSLDGIVWFFIKKSNNINRIHINNIVVNKDSRSKGVGKALFDKVENYAIERNIKEIELIVTKNNVNATKFYEKRNFEVERLIMKKELL